MKNFTFWISLEIELFCSANEAASKIFYFHFKAECEMSASKRDKSVVEMFQFLQMK